MSGGSGAWSARQLAHALAGGVHRLAVEAAVGPGEVDELEQAQLGVDALGGEGRQRPGAGGVDDHHLARVELADEVGAHDVEGGRLRGQDPPVVEPAQAQGAEAVGVAHPDHVGVVHQDQGEGALQLGQDLDQGPLEVAAVAAGGDLGRHGDADELGHQVAVVADGAGQDARPRPPACRCRPGCRCGRGRCRRRRRCGSRAGRCPTCWTRWWSSGRGRWPGGPARGASLRSSKAWATRPMSLTTVMVSPSLTAMPGRLLAPVLQGVEAEVGQLGDRVAGGVDPEDPAGLLGMLDLSRCRSARLLTR